MFNMKKIQAHPSVLNADCLRAICKPLNKLNISYFSHVNIDKEGQFSALTNNPEFHTHYLENSYYHADIHLSELGQSSKLIIWDALGFDGISQKMDDDAEAFNIRHTFTIVEKNSFGDNYYHFSTHIRDGSFNQIYLSNLDLLNMFIKHFNSTIGQSKELSKAYDIKFTIDQNEAAYSIGEFQHLEIIRSDFMREISLNSAVEMETRRIFKNSTFLIHKDTHRAVSLSKQQTRCLLLLMQGFTATETANQMNLSHRTINHYLENLRDKLGCRNGKELIAAYYSQLMQPNLF